MSPTNRTGRSSTPAAPDETVELPVGAEPEPNRLRPVPPIIEPAQTVAEMPAVMQRIVGAMDELDRYRFVDDALLPADDLDNVLVLIANVRADVATLTSCVRALARVNV